jgi:hypothetical protein
MKNNLRLIVFFLSMILFSSRGICQEIIKDMYNQITCTNGWKLVSLIELSENSAPKELLPSLSKCVREEVILFNQDATYKRIFPKGACTDSKFRDTHGTWSYLYDKDHYILGIKMKDLVDNSLSKVYMLASLSSSYKSMMLIANPDARKAGNAIVSVFMENPVAFSSQGNTPISVNAGTKKPETKSTNYLINDLKTIKSEELTPFSTPIENYSFNTTLMDFGVLNYVLKENGSDQINSLISFKKSGSTGYYLVDINNDDFCVISVFSFEGGNAREVTQEMMGEKILNGLTQKGFDYYNKNYFDDQLTFDESNPQLIFSLPSDNFVTINPEIYVEIKAKINNGAGGYDEDARIVGTISFNGKNFQFSWPD